MLMTLTTDDRRSPPGLSSPTEVPPTTLRYRGLRYQSAPFLMEGVEFQTNTVYRGVAHRLKSFSSPAPEASPTAPTQTLYYRGVAYQK